MLGLRVLVVLVSLFVCGQSEEDGFVTVEELVRTQGEEGEKGNWNDDEWETHRLQVEKDTYEIKLQNEKILLEREENLRSIHAQREIEKSNSEQTAIFFQELMKATDDDHSELENLIRSGVDVNRPNQNGETSLHVACLRGQVNVMNLLLRVGANPNARTRRANSNQDMTPLSWCVLAGQFEAAEALLDNDKTDVNMYFEVQGRSLMTSLDLARTRHNEDMVALLLEYKAKSFEELTKNSEVWEDDNEIPDEVAFQRFLNLEA